MDGVATGIQLRQDLIELPLVFHIHAICREHKKSLDFRVRNCQRSCVGKFVYELQARRLSNTPVEHSGTLRTMISSFSVILRNISWRYIFIVIAVLGILDVGLHHDEVISTLKSSVSQSTVSLTDQEHEAPALSLLIASTVSTPVASPTAISDKGKTLPIEEYLAFCVTAKDQPQDLPEFFQHHYYHMNVTRFYVMDDRSEPRLSPLQDYGIPTSALTFRHYTEEEAAQLKPGYMQLWLYQECINTWGRRHKWMMFIDADEFVEIRTDETLEGVLRDLEKRDNVGSLSMNWLTHTSGGLLTRPESVRQSFIVCLISDLTVNDMSQLDRHVKSIVRTDRFEKVLSSHMFGLNNDTIAVGEDGLEVKPGFAWRFPITRDQLVVHHYAVKSQEEYQQKLDRWKGDIPKDWAFWDGLESHQNHTECREMARYSP